MPKIKARTVLAVIAIVGYILLTACFFGQLFFGSKVEVPEGDFGKQIVGMLGMIVGTWGSNMAIVFMFYFGTTQSSGEKNKTVELALRRRVDVDPNE